MKITAVQILSVCGLILMNSLALAQTQLLPTTPQGFSFYSAGGLGTISYPSVTAPYGASFSQVADVNVVHTDTPHDVRVYATSTQTVNKADAMVVTFWYRQSPSTGKPSTLLPIISTGTQTIPVYPSETNITLTLSQGTSNSLSMPLRGRGTWRQVSVPFIAATTGPMQFEVDFAAAIQDVQIGGMQLSDYGQSSVLTATPNVVDCTSQFTDLSSGNGATCTKSTISVTGNPFFTQADQLNVSAGSSPIDTNVFIASNLAGAIKAGDTLVILFWVCRDSTSNQNNMGLTGYYLEQLSNNKTVGVIPNNNYSPLIVDGAWKQYCIPVTAGMTLPANGSRLWLVFGAATQIMDVAGIQVIDLGTAVSAASLTHNELDYPGRQLNANWQATAATNIQKYRTGTLTINVTDGSGNPLATTVQAQMTKQGFDFGTWSNWEYYLGNPKGGVSANPQYQAALDYYSGAGPFNQANQGDYKWPVWSPGIGSSPNWTTANQNIYLRNANITDIRGHNLIWPNYRKDSNGNYIDVPSTIPGLSGAALSSAVISHIDTEVSDPTVMSYITDWDVVNEPWTSRNIQAALSNIPTSGVTAAISASYCTTWFQEAAKEDPLPSLFINDDGAELNAARLTTSATNTLTVEGYDYTLLSDMIADGAPLDGYAFESHFPAPQPYSTDPSNPVPVAIAHPVTPPVTEKAIFDNFASLTSNGNPLQEQITEFDPQYPDQTLQADYMSDYLTLAFSEPNFNAFCLYGFTGFDGRTSNGTTVPGSSPPVYYGNVYNSDWSVSPSGEAWLSLVHGRWWTSATGTATGGVATVNGFLGRYALTASNAGITKTYYADLPTTAGATVKVKLGGSSGTSHVWLYEAENAKAIYGPFAIAKDVNASNGEYVTSSSSVPKPAVTPPQQLRIDMEATGKVNIWLRVLAPNTSSNTFVAGIDAAPSTTITLPVGSTWQWYKWTQVTLASGSAHQLRLNVGGLGAGLDEVLVTDDTGSSFSP